MKHFQGRATTVLQCVERLMTLEDEGGSGEREEGREERRREGRKKDRKRGRGKEGGRERGRAKKRGHKKINLL